MTPSKQLIILVGAPGTGKSTYCDKFLSYYCRISQDDQGRTGHLKEFKKALDREDPRIVIDRMGFSKEQRARYAEPARAAGYKIKIIEFEAPAKEVLIARIQERRTHPTLGAEANKKTIHTVLNLFNKEYQTPTTDEYDEFQKIPVDNS